LRAFVASVQGLVFTQDPMTTNGGPLPSASQAALDPLRSSVLLRDLDPPSGGNYALLGSIIAVKDVEPPPIAPPTEPVGTDFDFTTRTDNFAAINASVATTTSRFCPPRISASTARSAATRPSRPCASSRDGMSPT